MVRPGSQQIRLWRDVGQYQVWDRLQLGYQKYPKNINNCGYLNYPLMTKVAVERSTILNGTIHYFHWVIFNSYVTNYWRVHSTSDEYSGSIYTRIIRIPIVMTRPHISVSSTMTRWKLLHLV